MKKLLKISSGYVAMNTNMQIKICLGLGLLDWIYFSSNEESLWIDISNEFFILGFFIWPLILNTFLIEPLCLLMVIFEGVKSIGKGEGDKQ